MPATSERIDPENRSPTAKMLYHRHLFAYRHAAGLIRGDKDIADIGCGLGYGLNELHHPRISIGLDSDISPLKRLPSGALPIACDIVDIPLAASSMDALLCMQAIEHIGEPGALLHEASRILRPGGLLIMTTPNRRLRLKDGQRPWNRFHVTEYDASGFKALIEPHFKKVGIDGIIACPSVMDAERARLSSIRRLAGLDPLGLRYLLPEQLIQGLSGLLKPFTGGESRGYESKGEDYHITSDLEGCLDLLAVCTR